MQHCSLPNLAIVIRADAAPAVAEEKKGDKLRRDLAQRIQLYQESLGTEKCVGIDDASVNHTAALAARGLRHRRQLLVRPLSRHHGQQRRDALLPPPRAVAGHRITGVVG